MVAVSRHAMPEPFRMTLNAKTTRLKAFKTVEVDAMRLRKLKTFKTKTLDGARAPQE
jgi:hypothetical protein